MKKILSIALGLVMLVSLGACKPEENKGTDAANSDVVVETTMEETGVVETTVEETTVVETTVEETTVAETTAKAN